MATLILMPQLSPTMEEGVLAKWTRHEGDKISPGDIIAEVETDKANMDFPLEDEGVLLKLLVKEGDTVKLGAPVAVLGEAGEDPASALAGLQSATSAPAKAAAPASENKAAALVAAAPTTTTAERQRVSPLARKLAAEKQIDLASLTGSGPSGRIVKRDIEGAEKAPRGVRPLAPPAADELIAASQMRKAIARRLVEASQQIPHIYLTREVTCTRLLDAKTQLAELGKKVSVNDLVVKALALALANTPTANVSWTADGIVQHHRVDIGVAVTLPDGLITPVVRSADIQPLAEISKKIKELAERAKARKLKPEEYSNGTATVSNLGMFGISEFKAIINPPESLILAVGTTERRAVVQERDGREEIAILPRMTLTLGCDHRVVDGVLGAKVLGELVRLLENPLALVL